MKTTLNPRVVLMFLLLSSLTYQVQAAMTSEKKVVNAARFEDTWIPSIQLAEIEISASRSENKIVEAVKYKGRIIPSIQMNEVTIKASGIYDNSDIHSFGFVEPYRGKYLTEVVLYDGEYIPMIQLNEVQVEAFAVPINMNTQTVSAHTTIAKGAMQVNARQTFNVLIEFIISKSLEIVKHFVPASGN
ncbi:MAG: hypothetical protein IPK10_01110 [Bacteroidetes bacterium]|nr:hypothetical protein [Bacteroidota bacterium]